MKIEQLEGQFLQVFDQSPDRAVLRQCVNQTLPIGNQPFFLQGELTYLWR